METRQKWVNLTFIVAALLLGYVVSSIMLKVSLIFDFETRFKQAELAVQGTSWACGLALFIYLYKSDRTQQFTHEVIAELTRITWPTQKDTMNATILVMITVTVAGFFLGALDMLWIYLLQKLI